MKDKYGVLLAISSLPGEQGIGDFGESAYVFADTIKKRGYKYWQVLPINPVGPGNSPYMSTCSEAIEPRYIDLNWFVKKGLLKSVKKMPKSDKVDYQAVWEFKKPYLLKAFAKFKKHPIRGYKKFLKENHWVYPFAVFIYFREVNNYQIWNIWAPEMKFYFDNHKYNEFPTGGEEECEFHLFCQFIAKLQYEKLRKYLKKIGLILIADCPFYVGIDSTDCWLNKDQFIMNENYEPTLVSGCPPDAFSDDGQLWGTPIFNFKKMKEKNFEFLTHRIGYLATTCDYLRLDHFRAWDTYCIIPAEDENARRGKWEIGPRTEFFDELFRKYPNINLIAEDLGELFQGVHDLRDHYNFPGMHITEFTIFDETNPSKDTQIVYPGTHDNETIQGWLENLPEENIKYLKKKFGEDVDLFEAMFDFTWNTASLMTIFPLQDLMRLDNSARMNYPGTVGSPNWEWKLKDENYNKKIKYGL
ncbi:MAG: 4-alpha-glucanotransferase [Bacilli bacterium]|nr:4-alpha-glucanotransferase [Bacilli bacterium]